MSGEVKEAAILVKISKGSAEKSPALEDFVDVERIEAPVSFVDLMLGKGRDLNREASGHVICFISVYLLSEVKGREGRE